MIEIKFKIKQNNADLKKWKWFKRITENKIVDRKINVNTYICEVLDDKEEKALKKALINNIPNPAIITFL